MAAIVAHVSLSSLFYKSPSSQTSCSFLQRARLSGHASSSPPQHVGRTGFMDFPYVSAPHKDLMVDLVSTVENRLGALLKPCNLPPDVQSYQNETGTSHAALHLRSGVQSSQDTQLDQHRQDLEKLPEVKPYFSSSLYIRTVVSPTAILVRIETEQLDEMIETHVSPIAKQVLNTWLDVCAFGERVVSENDKVYLEKRDETRKRKTIEIDLGSNLPRLFGEQATKRVLEALKEVF